jgi:hypothetical protein
MQSYTIFFIMSKFYMFQAVSPPIIRSSKTVHTAAGIAKFASCYRLAIPDAVCTVFELLMMGGETA